MHKLRDKYVSRVWCGTKIHIVTIHIECFMQTNDTTVYRLVSKSRWNWIILYRVETNSCGMHMMRDKHVSRVWCENINTYRYNTYRDAYHVGQTSRKMYNYCYNAYRVFRADKWHDSISSRDEIWSYRIVSKRTRAGCISCGTNKQRGFGAET